MSIGYNHVRVQIDITAVQHNFDLIRTRAANPVPVIKSDAYGHGLPEVARALSARGATIMAAGTVAEAAILKTICPEVDVISLLGPLDGVDMEQVCVADLVPFVGSAEQLHGLHEVATRLGTTVRVALKFDTGMARLGFAAGDAAAVAQMMPALPRLRPMLVCSHLATADDPGQGDFVRDQGRIFDDILNTLRAGGADVRGCLANSAGIYAYPELHHALQRPGIALYGANPFHGTAWENRVSGLRQAMHVTAPVLQLRTITSGTTVSYGRTFTAPRDMRIGVVGIGYADNYSRGLSSTGQMLAAGQRVPVLGRVCMQLTAIDLTAVPEIQVGDSVYVLGGVGPLAISADEVAGWWGTIAYEVFCLLGMNSRSYAE